MSIRSRFTATASAAVCGTLLLPGAPASADPGPSGPEGAVVQRTVVLDAPAQAPDDQRTVFSGWVTGGGPQPVTLQLLDGDHWRDVASVGTDAAGRYRIAVRLDQATDTRWRVTAPATPTLAPGTSPALLIRSARG